MQWLKDKAPGFAQLPEDDLSQIRDFTLLWSLFEARILECQGSTRKIRDTVGAWQEAETLDAAAFSTELAYFRQRYFRDGCFTQFFNGLKLRRNDNHDLVESVISGNSNTPQDCVTVILIIVLRFRNNLFHGIKWQYKLADQHDNFAHANSILKNILERHGALTAE